MLFFFFFQAEDGIRDRDVTGVQTCALPISRPTGWCGRWAASSASLLSPEGRSRLASSCPWPDPSTPTGGHMMSMRPLRAALLAAPALFLASLLLPSSLAASGFSIYEQGGRGMGFSGA